MSATLGGRPVSAVLFDYGNTLITFERPDHALRAAYARIEAHLRERGMTPPDSAVLLRDVHDRVELEFEAHQRSGQLEEIDLVAAAGRAYADLGLPLDADMLDHVLRLEQEAWWEGVRLDPAAIPTIDELRRRGLRVGLCSNAPYRVRSMHDQLAHLGLDAHLDSVTFSGAVGWRKPSPRIFGAAVTALGAPPQATMMVGDSVHDDIEGARAAGLRAVLLRRETPQSAGDALPNGTPVVGDLIQVVPLLFGTTTV